MLSELQIPALWKDWCSLYQKDPKLWKEWMADKALNALSDGDLGASSTEGIHRVAERHAYEASRSAEQSSAFKRALSNTMDLWYSHTATTVVLLTELPEVLPVGFETARTYATRGWERAQWIQSCAPLYEDAAALRGASSNLVSADDV